LRMTQAKKGTQCSVIFSVEICRRVRPRIQLDFSLTRARVADAGDWRLVAICFQYLHSPVLLSRCLDRGKDEPRAVEQASAVASPIEKLDRNARGCRRHSQMAGDNEAPDCAATRRVLPQSRCAVSTIGMGRTAQVSISGRAFQMGDCDGWLVRSSGQSFPRSRHPGEQDRTVQFGADRDQAPISCIGHARA